MAIGAACTFLGAMGVVMQRFANRAQRDMSTSLAAAHLEAALRENELVTIEHVLLALSFDQAIEDRLRASGVDAARLREDLEAHLGPVVMGVASPVTVHPRVDGRVASLLVAAKGSRSGLTVTGLFDLIREGPESFGRSRLETLRGVPFAVRAAREERHAERGSPYRSAPSAGGKQLRFWNDKRTTIEFVARALVERCGLEASRARYLTLRVHAMGSAVVGVWREAEALALVEEITRSARAAGFALRVTMEPAGASDPGLVGRVVAWKRARSTD